MRVARVLAARCTFNVALLPIDPPRPVLGFSRAYTARECVVLNLPNEFDRSLAGAFSSLKFLRIRPCKFSGDCKGHLSPGYSTISYLNHNGRWKYSQVLLRSVQDRSDFCATNRIDNRFGRHIRN
jgi:hypothetical protein